MSYEPVVDEESAENLLYRKEFYQFKVFDKNFREGEIAPDKFLSSNSYQRFVANYMSPYTDNTRQIIVHQAGCHGIDTPIRMFDGNIKQVQDIVCGDILLGDDHIPKRVNMLYRGTSKLYKVLYGNNYENEFICNGEHLLTVSIDENMYDIRIIDLLQPSGFLCSVNILSQYEYICLFISSIIDKYGFSQDDKTYIYIKDTSLNVEALRYYLLLVGINNYIYGEKIVITVPLSLFQYKDYVPIITKHKYKIIPISDGKYYGFTLDGNGRYVLGNNIITHNSGKTITCVQTATKYISIYKNLYNTLSVKIHTDRQGRNELDRITPSVFIFGTTGTVTAFYRDFLKYPEFGFVSYDEIDELNRLKGLSDSKFEQDINNYKYFLGVLKRRVTNKYHGGFYKFFGYQTFINRLFNTKLNLIDLEKEASRSIGTDHETTLENIISHHISTGNIKINKDLLAQFEHSLIICDEFHHTYNASMKNNYGVALQYLLDNVKTLRALFLTATPINTSPTEIVDIVNFLNTNNTTRKDLFPNGVLNEELLKKLLFGKVSYLQDINPRYFPQTIFIGDDFVIPHNYLTYHTNDVLSYLKLTKCVMSSFHIKTLNNVILKKSAVSNSVSDEFKTINDGMEVSEESEVSEVLNDTEESEIPETQSIPSSDNDIYSRHVIGVNDYTVYDMAFPNPNSTQFGLVRTNQIRSEISGADIKWKNDTGIEYINGKYVGVFLHVSNIKKYSAKYHECLLLLNKILKKQKKDSMGEKIMIYHERVRTSGVLLIEQMLLANGYLDEYGTPITSTLCGNCGETMGEHKQNHQFYPARFLTAHSEMDSSVLANNISKFSVSGNAYGNLYKIFLGSKIIKESYDFKDVRHQIILSVPSSIPSLKQIIGRCVRKHSHANLQPDERNVSVYLLVNSTDRNNTLDTISPEEYRYMEKMINYMTIQSVERVMNLVAIDADVHRDIIMSPDTKKQYVDGRSFSSLYFTPAVQIKEISPSSVPTVTFNAYKNYYEEMQWISYIIKKLFTLQPVWKYSDLWNKVRDPPFGLEINPKLFNEGNFTIVLTRLCSDRNIINNIRTENDELGSLSAYGMRKNIINRILGSNEIRTVVKMFNYDDRNIYINNIPLVINAVGEYYILSNGVLDIETYIRPLKQTSGTSISIKSYIQDFKEEGIIQEQIDKVVANGVIGVSEILLLPINVQTRLIKRAIVAQFGKKDTFMSAIIEFYDSLMCLINADEVKLYKNVFALLNQKNKVVNGFIGYQYLKFIHIYDKYEDKWVSVSRISMNRDIQYREAPIIGFLDTHKGKDLKFKIRSAITSGIKDLRNAEKGIVCSTKSKESITEIANSLGIKHLNGKSTLQICLAIRQVLIDLEIKERIKETKNKHFYFWWDVVQHARKGGNNYDISNDFSNDDSNDDSD